MDDDGFQDRESGVWDSWPRVLYIIPVKEETEQDANDEKETASTKRATIQQHPISPLEAFPSAQTTPAAHLAPELFSFCFTPRSGRVSLEDNVCR